MFTKRKRFASGLELVYRIMFPLGIHSVTMQGQYGSTVTETPNNGRTFGWERCFQLMISRHNRWEGAETIGMRGVDRRYLVNLIGAPLIYSKALDGHEALRVFSVAHVCEPAVETNLPNAQELLSKDVRRGDDPTCSAYLREKAQTAPPEFVIKARECEDLCALALLVITATNTVRGAQITYLVKKIDECPGFAPTEVSCKYNLRRRGQE